MKMTLLGILALSAFPPALATASQFQHVSGTTCTKGYGDANNVASDSGYMITNWDTSTAKTVGCSVPFTSTSLNPISVNPSGARVDYYDSTPTGAIDCQMWLMSTTGTNIGMGERYSCATAGGCTDGNNTFYAGIGYISWPDTLGATANVVSMSFRCSIPALNITYGFGAIYSLAVSTSTP